MCSDKDEGGFITKKRANFLWGSKVVLWTVAHTYFWGEGVPEKDLERTRRESILAVGENSI